MIQSSSNQFNQGGSGRWRNVMVLLGVLILCRRWSVQTMMVDRSVANSNAWRCFLAYQRFGDQLASQIVVINSHSDVGLELQVWAILISGGG
ncbi:hypothetical protein Dimus_014637 [Dionaea muscipula]